MSSAELWFYLFVTTFPPAMLSYLACFEAAALARHWGLLDQPGGHKAHGKATPLGGGLAIMAVVVLLFAFGTMWLSTAQYSPLVDQLIPAFARPHLPGIKVQLSKLWLLLAGGTTLGLLGLWDDARRLDWRVRLGLQLAVAGACVALLPELRLTAFIALPVWTTALSVLWIVALVNAFNMLDNMDGLAAGIAVLCGIFLTAIILVGPNPDASGPQLFVAGLVLVLSGSVAGFLAHNYPPARLFLGDAGSYFIGFLFAAVTLLASYTRFDSDRPHAVLAPLFVMAVPLYDLTSVVLIRLSQGRSPFHADRNHFSHRLVDLGFSRPRAVQLIYLVTIISGLAAFLLHRVDTIGAGVLSAMLLCLFAVIASLETTARRTMKK